MNQITLQQERDAFSTSPDPAFLYRSGEHLSILNRLEISIRLRQGLNIVVGDVGTGKTTLARALIAAFSGEKEQYIFHMILEPSFKTETQFLNHLTALFGISPFNRSNIDHRRTVEKYLYKKYIEEGKTVALIIDEGQRLAAEHFEILKTWIKFGENELPLLQLAIFVQTGSLDNCPMFDDVNVKHTLTPLDEYDTEKMITFRLKKAGHPEAENLFTKEAIKKIHAFTRGYPRQTVFLCHRAMEQLAVNNQRHVTAELIGKIIAEEMVFQ